MTEALAGVGGEGTALPQTGRPLGDRRDGQGHDDPKPPRGYRRNGEFPPVDHQGPPALELKHILTGHPPEPLTDGGQGGAGPTRPPHRGGPHIRSGQDLRPSRVEPVHREVQCRTPNRLGPLNASPFRLRTPGVSPFGRRPHEKTENGSEGTCVAAQASSRRRSSSRTATVSHVAGEGADTPA